MQTRPVLAAEGEAQARWLRAMKQNREKGSEGGDVVNWPALEDRPAE